MEDFIKFLKAHLPLAILAAALWAVFWEFVKWTWIKYRNPVVNALRVSRSIFVSTFAGLWAYTIFGSKAIAVGVLSLILGIVYFSVSALKLISIAFFGVSALKLIGIVLSTAAISANVAMLMAVRVLSPADPDYLYNILVQLFIIQAVIFTIAALFVRIGIDVVQDRHTASIRRKVGGVVAYSTSGLFGFGILAVTFWTWAQVLENSV